MRGERNTHGPFSKLKLLEELVWIERKLVPARHRSKLSNGKVQEL
jgi:hypothetical protein